ncbi:DNA replication complex GINS protein SLD5-like isoform X2 [Lineus longissimus]
MDRLLDDQEDNSNEEGETMTASEVLQKLEEAWKNEQFSPELLEIKVDIVECIAEQIRVMEDNIQRAKKNDFKVTIHNMEINRIRFMLSSYLRERLKKIEENTSYILVSEAQRRDDEPPHLSPEEYQYAKEFLQSMDGHYKSLVLRHLPLNLQSLESRQAMVPPNLESYVFLKVNEKSEGVLIEEETAESR